MWAVAMAMAIAALPDIFLPWHWTMGTLYMRNKRHEGQLDTIQIRLRNLERMDRGIGRYGCIHREKVGVFIFIYLLDSDQNSAKLNRVSRCDALRCSA